MYFSSDLYIEMSFGNCPKWHFRDPTFQKFLGRMSSDPPGLERLRRSIPLRAYTFELSRYALEWSFLYLK